MRLDASVFGEQVEEVRPTQQLKRLPFGELERGFPVPARCDENAFRGALVLHRPVV
jgi:hypothetical protein